MRERSARAVTILVLALLALAACGPIEIGPPAGCPAGLRCGGPARG